MSKDTIIYEKSNPIQTVEQNNVSASAIDLEGIKCLKTLKGHTSAISSLAISSEGYLCSGGGFGDNSIKIWDINSGECLRTLKGHTNCVCL